MILFIFGIKYIEWLQEKAQQEYEKRMLEYKVELEITIENFTPTVRNLGKEMEELAAKTDVFKLATHRVLEKRNTVNPHERNFKNRRKW